MAHAQQSPNLMAVTSQQDTIYFSAPDSALRLDLPPKTIRLFTTSQLLQSRLASAYPGIKWVRSFGKEEDVTTPTGQSVAISPAERPYIYVESQLFPTSHYNADFKTFSHGTTRIYKLKVNNRILNERDWREQVIPYLESDPQLVPDLEKVKFADKVSTVSVVTFWGGLILAVATFDSDKGSDDDESFDKGSLGPATMLGIVLAGISSTLYYFNLSSKDNDLVKAIRRYNENLAIIRNEPLPVGLYTEKK